MPEQQRSGWRFLRLFLKVLCEQEKYAIVFFCLYVGMRGGFWFLLRFNISTAVLLPSVQVEDGVKAVPT